MAYDYTQRRTAAARQSAPRTNNPQTLAGYFGNNVSRPVLAAGLDGEEGVGSSEMANILTTPGPGTDVDIRSRQADDAIFAGTKEAFDLSDENNARNEEGKEFLLQEYERAHGSETMTDEHMRMILGLGYDEASGVYRDQMGSLRDALGFTGGNMTMGLARDTEMQRLGQMDTVRTNAVLEKAKSDAMDREKRWAASSPVYAALTKEADAEKLNWLAQLVGVRLAQQGQEQNLELGREAAVDAKQGAILGGALGLGGALAGLGG